MVFTESERFGYGNGQPATESSRLQPHPPEDQSLKDPSFSPLSGQNSLLSLTLNEIQLKRGKSFGSMNMDEFLANLWNVDENQVSSQPTNQTKPIKNDSMVNNQPTLTRQGSFSIPAPLCKKTVDEVWFDIQKDQPQQEKPNNVSAQEPPQRQQTLGEITLEDFLIKAGVVQEAPTGSSQQKMVTPIQNSNTCLDVDFGIGHVIRLGFSSAHHQTGNGFGTYRMFPQGNGYVEEAENSFKNENGNNLMDLAAQQNKRRIIDGPTEVVVERRQRRMIKNRESAARSRARKQAYTVELELELNQLKEENAKLTQIVEEIEKKRKEKVMRKKQSPIPQKKAEKLRDIRRTVSMDW